MLIILTQIHIGKPARALKQIEKWSSVENLSPPNSIPIHRTQLETNTQLQNLVYKILN